MSSRVKHEAKFWTSKKHNTMIVHLETNNINLCLNHEYLKYVLQ